MMRLFCCLLIAAASLLADVTGKWSGSFDITGPDGETNANNVLLDLQQSGDDLSGTAGPNADHQFQISNGKVDGSKLSFDVKSDDGPSLRFELRLENDHMVGDAKGEMQGMKMTAKLNVTRLD
jgi:hypothetical protein